MSHPPILETLRLHWHGEADCERFAQALAARPDLRAAELAVEAAGKRLGLERARIFQGLLRFDGQLDAQGFHPSVGVHQIELPIFNWNPGGRARAKAEMQRALWRYAAVRQQIVAEVATLRAEVADLRGELATGVIGPDVAAREIVAPLRRIAHLRGSTPKQRKSWRSRVERLLRNRLGHSRRGATWARLDRKLLTVAQNSIGEWLDDAIAYARKNPPGQMTLPGTGRRPSTERPS